MEAFNQSIESLVREAPIDINRIYAIGHSVEGLKSWQMPRVANNRFAVILPMSGAYIHDAITLNDEYPYLSIWSFLHVRDLEGGVGAAREVASELANIGINVTVFSDLDTDEARQNAARKLDQPLRYFSSELSADCSMFGGCHFEGIDTAAREPLFFSWLFQQHRINPSAILELNANVNGESIDVNWQVPIDELGDDISIWLDENGDDNWILLGQVAASTLNFSHSLELVNATHAKIRLTIMNEDGFIYGVIDSDIL